MPFFEQLNNCERLIKAKLKINRSSVKFMGNEITADGLRLDPTKTEAIQNMPPPVDRRGHQRILGMVTYLARYAPGFATTTAPLRELLKQYVEFHWYPNLHGEALNTTTEQDYVQIEKELLACCFALERFHSYAYGRHVTVQTDHHP